MALTAVATAGVKIAQRTWQSSRFKAKLWFHMGSVKCSVQEACSQRASRRVIAQDSRNERGGFYFSQNRDPARYTQPSTYLASKHQLSNSARFICQFRECLQIFTLMENCYIATTVCF